MHHRAYRLQEPLSLRRRDAATEYDRLRIQQGDHIRNRHREVFLHLLEPCDGLRFARFGGVEEIGGLRAMFKQSGSRAVRGAAADKALEAVLPVARAQLVARHREERDLTRQEVRAAMQPSAQHDP